MAKNDFCKYISLIILIPLLAGCQAALSGPILVNAPANQEAESSIDKIIQDPLIQEGWNHLHQMENVISLWDGRSITGRELAGYLLQKGIPVVWVSDEICGGGSCSRLYCGSKTDCSFEDGQPGIDPIYINQSIRSQTSGQVARLAAELAHEIFHRLQPFGSVMDTQYEEYWAFYITAQVSKATWPDFQGYDPMDRNQLKEWFTIHTMHGYLKLAVYPQDLRLASLETGENEMPTSNLAKDLAMK